MLEAVDELETRVQTMVESRESIRNGLGSLHREMDRLEQQTNRSEQCLDKIERVGMSEGLSGSSEDWKIPLPPTADLREVEKVILWILDTAGTQRSVQALARTTAGELRGLAEEIGAHPGEVDMDVELTNACIRIDSDPDLGETFEEFTAGRLRNRLQYNLQSLEEKGYLHREKAEDDSRRVTIELSATGELWNSIWDGSVIRRTATEEELIEQLQQFIDRDE